MQEVNGGRPTTAIAASGRAAGDWPLIGYSVGNFGKNLLLSGVDVTLLFLLTDLLDIAPSAASALMLVVFFGDLLFDIGAGYLASWGHSNGFGYRRIIALGAVPCGAAFALLYSLPALGVRGLGVLAVTLLTFRAAYAIVDVPHNCLLARIAHDSHSRGRASGYRLFFSSLASLAIATVLTPSVVEAARFSMTASLSLLGIAGACLCCLALWMAAWSSGRDQSDRINQRQSASRIALLPKPDRLVAGIAVLAFVTGFAMPMFGRMVIYLAIYVFDRPAFASQILLAVTLGQFPGVLFWTYLIRFSEKTTLLAISYLVAATGIVLFALAGPRSELLIAVAVLIGVGLAGVFMLPWGILADVIDFAEFRHGERRETAAFAGILVILKAGGAVSVASIGFVLGRLGYAPGVHQASVVLLGMKILAFGVPLVGSAAAILVLMRLSVGHSLHARVRRALAARRRHQGSRGSIGSTRMDDIDGRKISAVGDSRAPTLPG